MSYSPLLNRASLHPLKTYQADQVQTAVQALLVPLGEMAAFVKPGLHLQAGSNKHLFALMLLKLCEVLAPQLTIVDAVIGMEGEGPGSELSARPGLNNKSPQPVAGFYCCLTETECRINEPEQPL